MRVGDEVIFWYDSKGWVGPGLVTELDGHVVKSKHGGIIKSADVHIFRSASKARCVQGTDSLEEDIFKANEDTDEKIQSKVIAPEASGVKTNRHRSTQEMILVEESRAIVEDLPGKSVLHLQQQPHMATLRNDSKTLQEDQPSSNEKLSSYRKKESRGLAIKRLYLYLLK